MNTKKRKARRGAAQFDALVELDRVRRAPSFGELVKSLRLSDEISQTEMARKLGISKQHLSLIEQGEKAVSVGRAAKFAEALGYPVQQFVIAALQDELNNAGIDLSFDIGRLVNE